MKVLVAYATRHGATGAFRGADRLPARRSRHRRNRSIGDRGPRRLHGRCLRGRQRGLHVPLAEGGNRLHQAQSGGPGQPAALAVQQRPPRHRPDGPAGPRHLRDDRAQGDTRTQRDAARAGPPGLLRSARSQSATEGLRGALHQAHAGGQSLAAPRRLPGLGPASTPGPTRSLPT